MDCETIGNIISSIGLSIDILGAAILFKFASPQPDYTGGFSLGLEDNNLLEDGRTVLEHRKDKETQKDKYQKYSKIGLLLLIIGFFFQIVGSWFK